MLKKTLVIVVGMPVLFSLLMVAQEPAQTLPEDEHTELYMNVCGSCHAAEDVIGQQRDYEAWYYTVDRMAQKGAEASDEELDIIVNYLVKYYGTPVNINIAKVDELKTLGLTEEQASAVIAAREKHKFQDFAAFTAVPALKGLKLEGVKPRMVFPKPLPEDPNRQTLVTICGTCHTTDIVADEPHNRASWEKLVGRMKEHGAQGSEDDFKKIVDYLVQHFGTKSGA